MEIAGDEGDPEEHVTHGQTTHHIPHQLPGQPFHFTSFFPLCGTVVKFLTGGVKKSRGADSGRWDGDLKAASQ
jgi:hypothetical protein